jgi:hypothetical protein
MNLSCITTTGQSGVRIFFAGGIGAVGWLMENINLSPMLQTYGYGKEIPLRNKNGRIYGSPS